MAYTEPVKFSKTNCYGCGHEDDVYTVAEFIQAVESGAFIDYDGYGHPVRDGMSDTSIVICPSTAAEDIPSDATHVVWFNR